MENIVMFLAKFYFIFVIISVFLIFALIGYFLSKKNENPFDVKEEEVLETVKLESPQEEVLDTIEELKTQIGEKGNVTLKSAVENENKSSEDLVETLMD